MKKLKTFFSILMISISILTFAQGQTSPNVKAKTEVATQQSLTKSATKTPLLFKGMPVYKSAKGRYFVVRQSKKTGNYYTQTVEVK